MKENNENKNPLDTSNTEYKPIQTIITRSDDKVIGGANERRQ